MAGLCGWLDGEGSPVDRSVLTRMTDVLAGDDQTGQERTKTSHGGGSGAVAVVAPPGAAVSLYEERGCRIAWIGAIDWSTESERERARKQGDGRAILEAYSESGPSFLGSIRSDVAIAIVNHVADEIVLAVDRIGIHSLTYYTINRHIVFASEGKALREHPQVTPEVDPQAIFDYVYFHMVPSPRSSFKGFRKLGPGEYLFSRGGRTEIGKYWKPHYIDRSKASERDLIDECRRTSRAAIATCMRHSNGRVGAFLSGGVDSSTVAGLLTELSGEPASTYTIGFDVPGFDESDFANIAVNHFGTNHHEYLVTPDDVLRAAPAIASAFSEPFGNASAIASLYCARLAKEDGVSSLFAGDGGDEIFAGNERYAKQQLFELYYSLPAAVRHSILEPLASVLPDGGWGPVTKAGSYVKQARIPLPDRLNTYNYVGRLGLDKIFAPEYLETISTEEPNELFRETYGEADTESVLHRLLYLDIKFTLADNDLRKVGRTCEMAGIDVRYPFLDLDFIEFANRVPPGLKLRGQKLRYFFKRASEGFLPDEILTKSKHGFGVPCGLWMRDHPPLRELAYDSLGSLVNRGYLRPAFVENLKQLHQGEHVGYYGVMVWVLTMLELWHQQHVD